MAKKSNIYIFFSIFIILILVFSYYLNINKKIPPKIEQVTKENEEEIFFHYSHYLFLSNHKQVYFN